jgi:LysM repeat protein
MKWLPVMASVLFVPLLHAGELELLRNRCAEQERQIRDLETEVARLRSELQQFSNEGVAPAGTGDVLDIRRAGAESKPGAAAAKNLYTVKKGDTLSRIARHFGTTVEAIVKRNSISKPSSLRIGTKLEIPTGKKASGAAAPKAPAPPKAPKAPAPQGPPAPSGDTYKVKKGDTFYSIAKGNHTTTEALSKANPGLDPARLRIGQVIRLSSTAPRNAAMPETGPPKPARQPETAKEPSKEAMEQPAPAKEPAFRLVKITKKITFGDFAAKHGATVDQLNEMNGQNLAATTLLDAGSELYVPIHP